jgi:hypothetical protein
MPTFDLSRRPRRPLRRPHRLLLIAVLLVTGALVVGLVTSSGDSAGGTQLGPAAEVASRDLATTLSEAGTLQRSGELTVAYAGALTSGTGGDSVLPQDDDGSSGDDGRGDEGDDGEGSDDGGDGGDGISPAAYFTGDDSGSVHPLADDPSSTSSSSSTTTTACPASGSSSTSSTSTSSTSSPCPSTTTSSSSTSTTSTTTTAPPGTNPTTPPPAGDGGDRDNGGGGGEQDGQPSGQSPAGSGDEDAGSATRLPSPSGGAGNSSSDGGSEAPSGGDGGEGSQVPSATLTGVLDVGATADRGSVLFTADDEPVVALIGQLPAWRTLSEGVDDGADVRQLEENLVALGYGAGLTVDESFTAETAAAVEAWETALGRTTPDGTVTIGDVVFLAAPGDVLGHEAEVGDTLEPGSAVLRIGSEQRIVVADVDVTESGGWTAGSTVELEWADTTTSTGTVFGTGRDVSDEDEVDLIVVVTAGAGGAGERASGAEATVTLVDARRDSVVAVPVSAIVDDHGSPAVRVARDDAPDQLVPVETGLVAEGWVEITSGLTANDRVRLPG